MVLKPSFSDNINCGEIYRTNRKQSIQNYIKVCLNENICLKTEYFYCPETMVREAFIQYLQKMGMLFYLRAFVILYSCQGNNRQTSSFIKLTFLKVLHPPPPHTHTFPYHKQCIDSAFSNPTNHFCKRNPSRQITAPNAFYV